MTTATKPAEAESQVSSLKSQSFTFIEFVDEPAHDAGDYTRYLDRNTRVMAESIHFLGTWLSVKGMPMSIDELVHVMAHANNVQHGALRLMNVKATDRADGQRRAAAGSQF